MKRIDSVNNDDYYATKRDGAGGGPIMVDWFLHLPGQAIWPDYMLVVIDLNYTDGKIKFDKEFPEATHEIIMAALDPSSTETGNWTYMTPINYQVHVEASGDEALATAEEVVVRFVNQAMPAEPSGVTINGISARDFFCDMVARILLEKKK